MEISVVNVFSVFMVLFAVIDIIGSIPIIVDLKSRGNKIQAGKATIVAFGIMLLFLFLGESLLSLFGVDISSFAIAGAFVLFILALEMVLGAEFFKNDSPEGASIVPIAFPLVAGAGSITSLLSLKAEFNTETIAIGLALNMGVVYAVLRLTRKVEKLLGQGGILILRKMFGIILLAIAVKLFVSNTGIELN